MKNVTLLTFLLLAFSWHGNAQILNQNAAWPNAAWALTGTFNGAALIADPTVSANLSYDDDAAGSGSTDIIFAASPVIDLTPAFGGGETEIYLDFDYNYNFGGSFDLEWYDADGATWVTWEAIPDNSSTTSNWCGSLPGAVTSGLLDISGFTGTQLSGFQYRLHYDASSVFGWGFCFAAPTIYSAAPPSCLDPSGLAVSNITTTTVDVSWTSGSMSTTQWDVSVVPSGSGPVVGFGIATNPYTVMSLTSNTAYDAYVRDICAPGDSSSWIGPVSFTTLCAPLMAPFLEEFPTNSLPTCWTQSGDTPWEYGSNVTTPAGFADYGADFAPDNSSGGGGTFIGMDGSDNGNGEVSELLTPFIDVTPLTVPRLKYYVFYNNVNDAALNKLIVDFWDGAAWTQVDSIQNNLGGSWVEFTTDLSTFTITGPVQVRFTVTGDNSFGGFTFHNDILIDDVSIEETPSCLDPSAIAVSNITDNSADVSWTAGNAIQLGWEVSVVPSGDMPIPGTPGTSTYNVTGLTNNTNYDVYVREICTPGDTTGWVGPVSFLTDCGTVVGDDDTNPIVATGLSYSDAGSTATCYTNTSDGPGSNGASDVWYSYTLDNCAGSVVASLCGSSYDTYLAIYAADGTTVLASNDDDFVNCGSSSSYVDMDILATAGVNPGDLIYVVVDGFGSNNGAYTLDITTTLAPTPTTTVVGAEISADLNGATYQWLDCDNGDAIIPGATDQTFVGAISGNYAVEVTNFGCVDTSACAAVTVSLPADLVISEINYNGAEFGTDSTEYIEIYNNGPNAVNLLGYSFLGVTHTVTENLVLPSGGYQVFAVDSAALANVYGYTGAQQWTSGALSNTGEAISLFDGASNLVDFVDYEDGGVWPSAADGNGPSLVICNFSLDNNDGSNWFASTTDVGAQLNGIDLFGSPGAANVCVIQCPSAFAVSACDSYTVPSGDETYTMSGVYVDTIPGSAGCDSIMTITVTINNSNTGTDVITACDSYTWIDGMTYTASNNTATFVISGGNQFGCDSTVTLDLTINNSNTGTDVITECDSLTWIDGVTYYASTNTPTFTIAGGNQFGCDSTVTLDLTIIPNAAPVPDAAMLPDVTDECSVTLVAPTATDDCSGALTGTPDVTFPITTQGTTVVTWTFDDGAGLTTTQTQTVIINDVTPPTASNPFTLSVQCIADVPAATPGAVTDEADNCGTPVVAFVSEVSDGQTCPETLTRTYSVTDAGGNSITVTQTIIINDNVAPVLDMAMLPDATGFCDVTPATPTATDNCTGTINGVPDVTFPINTVGTTTVTWTFTDDCGNSVTQTQDVVITEINTNTSFASDGITILADNNTAGVTYQWYNCTADSLMTGETNFNFTPTFSADFAVIITEDGCVDTSACVTITEVGIEDILMNSVQVYPNPVKDIVNVELAGLEDAQVRILDMSGKVLRDEEANTTGLFIMEMNEAPGAYIIEVQSNGFVRQFKMIKE